MISRQALALIKALLIEYRDNVGHPNYRRLMASLLRRFFGGTGYRLITSHIANIMSCAREQHPIVKGELLCNAWEFLNTLGTLLALTTSLIPLRVALTVTKIFIIIIYHLTRMAHFVPCHKEITSEELAYLLISYC